MSEDPSPSSVRVVVRVRPENPAELCQSSSNCLPVIRVLDKYCLIFDPKEDEDSFIPGSKASVPYYGPKKQCRDIRFAFDRVFEGNCRQQAVYLETTRGVVERAMGGVNCSVFAYGATGAGKTYTMLGSTEEPGVTYRTVKELFDMIESKDDMSCDVKVCYLEVYNETIHDLLKPSGVLAVREDPEKGVCVKGLSFYKPKSALELLEMLQKGNENRTQHPTDANAQSSRSHAVFQVYVRQKPRTAGLSTQVKVAKISLIDLAGSERATMTTNRGMRLREGANINRSLLALGNCINALAELKNDTKRATYVPYRDSKLTRLLKDSLGGNCYTVMVANVSPSKSSYEDTYNTLKYAQRAKSIKSKLTANTMNINVHVSQYRSIIESLQAENNGLKLRLQQMQTVPDSVPAVNDITESSVIDKAIHQRVESLLAPFNCVSSTRLDLIDIEAAERDAKAKELRKERNIQRMTAIGRSNTECVLKWQANLSAIRARQSSLDDRQKKLLQQKQTAEQQLKQNVTELGVGSFSLDSAQSVGCNTIAELIVRNRQLEMEHAVLTRQLKHCKQFIKAQNKTSQNTEKLIQHLCTYIASISSHFTSTAGSMPLPLQTAFENAIRLIEGSGKEVAWADQAMNSNISSKQSPINQCRDFSAQTPAIATTSGILTSTIKCSAAGKQRLGDVLPSSSENCAGASTRTVVVRNPVAISTTSRQNDSDTSKDMCVSHAKKLAVEMTDNMDGSESVQCNGSQSLSTVSLTKKVPVLPPPPRMRTPRRPRRRGTFTVHNPVDFSRQIESDSQGSTHNWAMNTDPTALESLFKPLVCPATPKAATPRQIITRRTPNSKSRPRLKSPPTGKESKASLPQRVVSKKKSRGDGDEENRGSCGTRGIKRPHDGSTIYPAKRTNVTANSMIRKRGHLAGVQTQPSTPGKREWHVWN